MSGPEPVYLPPRATLTEVFTYHAPSEPQINTMQEIRHGALQLAELIEAGCPSCADRSAAIRKLREAVMTANAAIVLEGKV